MQTQERKSTLVVTRHAPYSAGIARAALDTALALAAFDQPVSILFQGEGVLQLLPDQAAEDTGMKSLFRQISSLVLYEVHDLYVDAASVERLAINLSGCPIALSSVQPQQIRGLLMKHDTILGF